MQRPLVLLLALLMLIIEVPATHATDSAQTTPRPHIDALYRYYFAINQGDYVTAYDLRNSPTQTLREFINGWQDTQRVLPYFRDVPVGQAVPAVLLGFMENGTVETFYGCIGMAQSSTGAWQIDRVNLAQLPGSDRPSPNTIAANLPTDCAAPLTPQQLGAYTPPEITMLDDYFTAINEDAYDAAYSLWLRPDTGPYPNAQPSRDYRPEYGSFGTGYADTDHIMLYPGFVQTAIGTAAFQRGYTPVVLVAQAANGSVTSYSGCYAIGLFDDVIGQNGVTAVQQPRYGIINGELNVLRQGNPTFGEINDALTIRCSNIPDLPIS